MKHYDVIIIGGGAAGFFAAINIAEQNPRLTIAILERSKEVLTKVKVSGGGRCNVTHAEFMPSELAKNYPRGQKELIGPFHTFMTGDTIEWFEKKGIALKIEEDGRMFPISNSSQTIIDCFLNEVKRLGITVLKSHSVKNVFKQNNSWLIEINNDKFISEKLLVASGSNTKIWGLLKNLGHSIIDPVPSLFTFNIKDDRIKNIPGVVAQNVTVKIIDSDLKSEGPLLITHWGMSAPAILKLSAFGALELAKLDYKFQIEINFAQTSFDDCLSVFKKLKQTSIKKRVFNLPQFELPKRLWQQLVLASNINIETRWQDLNKNQLEQLATQLTKAVLR